MEQLGVVSYPQTDIDNYCFLVGDTNPFHKRGRVPLNLAMGTITGRLFSWGQQKQGIKLAYITNQTCKPHHSLRVGKTYQLLAGNEPLDGKSSNIIFEIYDQDLPPSPATVILSGSIQVKYT